MISMKNYLLCFCCLPLLLFSQSNENQFSSSEIKELISKYKKDVRGPYKDLRWFCDDGTLQMPKEPCEEGGVQHARYKDEVVRLGENNHVFFGQILASSDYDAFWDNDHQLFKDEYDPDFTVASTYRGQNANMHSCEALIAAYEATQEVKFLTRALSVAQKVTQGLTEQANGWIWEHYHSDWTIDWDYNKTDPKNLFRPWGFQPGHHTEWAKLLLILNQHAPADWLVYRAQMLFDEMIEIAWDRDYGGICYGVAPDKSICDDDKYFWVQAESFACAARLALVTQDSKYWQWYTDIWKYSWQNLIDHEFGAWFRILTRENEKIENTKSPIGKTDYHTMGACYDVIDAIKSSM